MLLRFDTHTLQHFKDQGITDIHVFTKKMGCAGLKVFFEPFENSSPGSKKLEAYHLGARAQITIHCTEKDAKLLDGGQIAVANGKTYFSSPHVKGRCGCGTSISFTEKKIDLSMSKIHRLSEKLSSIPDIQKALKKDHGST